MLEPGAANRIGTLALGDLGGLAELACLLIFREQGGFHSLRWGQGFASASRLFGELADRRVISQQLLEAGSCVLPRVVFGVFPAAEDFDFGEFCFGGGALLAEAGKHGIGIGDILLGAAVFGGGLFEAIGGFPGVLKGDFGLG